MFVIYKEIVKNSKLDQEAQRHKTDICSNSFWKQVKARPPPHHIHHIKTNIQQLTFLLKGSLLLMLKASVLS